MHCPQHHASATAFQSNWTPQIEMLRGLMDDIRDEITGWDDVYGHDTEVEEINTEGHSGFIPTTDGGFDLCVPADMAMGEGSGYLPNIIKPYAEQARKDAGDYFLDGAGETFGYDPTADYGDETWGRAYAFVSWLEEIASEPAGQGSLPMGLPRHGYPLHERAREKLYEYEDESLRATYFYKVRAILYSAQSSRNDSGKDEVYLIAGVCTDFEYGRDSGTTWVFEKTIPLADLTEELIADLFENTTTALSAA